MDVNKSKTANIRGSKVLYIANYIGKILLQNGAETYRVEDTVNRICTHYGLVGESSATLTCIISSARTYKGELFSSVERISSRTTNLDKVHEINDLVRNLEKYSSQEVLSKAIAIERSKSYSNNVILLSYVGGAAAFAVLFKGGVKDCIGAGIGGFFLYWLINWASKLKVNQFFYITLGGALCSFNAYIFLKFGLLDDVSTSIIGSLMLLVPGISFTNSIRDLIAGEMLAGISRGVEAILIAASLAIGSGFALYLLRDFGGI